MPFRQGKTFPLINCYEFLISGITLIASQPRKGVFVFDPIFETLYNDCDESMRAELEESHIPTAISAFTTPVLAPMWSDPALDGRRVYIHTEKDQVFPPQFQEMFVQGSGVDWKVVRVDSGHSSFVSIPEGVAKIIIDAAASWS